MDTRKLIFAIVALLLVVLFLVQRCTSDRYNWDESDTKVSYVENAKEPYSTIAFWRLAQEVFGSKLSEITKPGLLALEQADPNRSTYVFVGLIPYYDSTEVSRLLQFVRAGGSAFVSSHTISNLLSDSLFFHPDCYNTPELGPIESSSKRDTQIVCRLEYKPSVMATYGLYYRNRLRPNYWPTIPNDWLCDELDYAVLGRCQNDMVNFIRLQYGEGEFYLHTLPMAFTNFHLLRKETHPYLNGLMAYMQNEQIYWDTYAKSDEARNKALAIPRGAKTIRNNGLLATLLREPALAFSWFIFLGLVGLFIIFGSKRDQRMIPVIPPLKNGTLQFVRSLARLQFREQNFSAMCKQDMRFFLNTVRERTGIHVHMQPDGLVPYTDQLLDRISAASGYPRQHLKEIFARYEPCAIYAPNGDMMADLHIAIEQFIHYKHNPVNRK
jgi:hypothetical protein